MKYWLLFTWAPYLPALVTERRDTDDFVPIESFFRIISDGEEGSPAVALASILALKMRSVTNCRN